LASTITLALCCLAGTAFPAFHLEPPLIVLKADIGERMAWLDVVHTGGGPMAVELVVLERKIDLDGEAITTGLARSDDFTVHPAQIILQPGERQRVQVAYKGRQRVTADKVYNLFSKEVPLPVMDEEAGVRTGVNTLVNYYTVIAFETGKLGRLTFVSSKMIGNGVVEVIVENKGSGRVPGEGIEIIIGGKERIRGFTGTKNSIMPGQQRRFTFEYRRPLTAGEVTFGHK
jgi:P pilus assembly chaperone PapD